MVRVRIIITSVVAGVHRTKVGSHPQIELIVGAHRDVQLLVENDDSIADIDPDCMLVTVSSIEDIPPELHSEVSYHATLKIKILDRMINWSGKGPATCVVCFES